MSILTCVGLAAGTALLFFGRRLYWMLVLGLGVALGFSLSLLYGLTLEDALPWVMAASSGLAALLLARLVPRVAAWITGLVAGIYAGALLLLVLHFSPPFPAWGLQLGAGAVGLLCFGLWFGRSLMVFSVIIGAGLIVNSVYLGVPARPLLFLVLLVAGWASQRQLGRPTDRSTFLETEY